MLPEEAGARDAWAGVAPGADNCREPDAAGKRIPASTHLLGGLVTGRSGTGSLPSRRSVISSEPVTSITPMVPPSAGSALLGRSGARRGHPGPTVRGALLCFGARSLGGTQRAPQSVAHPFAYRAPVHHAHPVIKAFAV